ncbi:E3 ubiquitin-protein ligase ZSWIM2 [Amia ocellicauda]|uniref:E3 ubiquitin-protein ligase ZSWIM2 n=1 Tax=Amia ocellicauda TaxID=2972642 RepID=UPI0034639733
MIRNSSRKCLNDLVSWHQDQALNTTILILRESGPTGFLLKEEGESKSFKVYLGDPHTCTCPAFLKEKDLCRHICWVLLRKFRLPRDHEYCFQLGLVERQITYILQGQHRVQTPRPTDSSSELKQHTGVEDGCVRQKEIDAEDVCPICQEELLKKRLPVSYCRYGCGNSVHISCMKIWADHQTRSETDTMVKCPLCREDFSSMKFLLEQVKNAATLVTAAERQRLDRHLGIACNGCMVCPISGKCLKCTVCSDYHLCEECFRKQGHPSHVFVFRLKRTLRWRLLDQAAVCGQPPSEALGDKSMVSDFESMKKQDRQEFCKYYTLKRIYVQRNDAAILISISMSSFTMKSEKVPEHIVKSLPLLKVRASSKLMEPGQQCRLCLKIFSLGQYVRELPCHHKFHLNCIDKWFSHGSNSCPLDGQVIYNTLTWSKVPSKDKLTVTLPSKTQSKMMVKPQEELFVPGIGLSVRPTSSSEASNPVGAEGSTSTSPVITSKDMILNGFQCLHLNQSPTDGHGIGNISHQKQPPKPKLRHLRGKTCHSSEHRKSEESRTVVSANTITRSSFRTPGLQYKESSPNTESLEPSTENRGSDKTHADLFVGLNVVYWDSAVQRRESSHPGRNQTQRRPNYRRAKNNNELSSDVDPALKMQGIPINIPIQQNTTQYE